MDTHTDVSRSRTRKPRPSRLKLRGEPLFAIFVLLGSVAIFLSEPYGAPYALGILVPLVLMGIYLIVGVSGMIDAVDRESFADSVYYIGFLFTLVSLAAALFYLRNDDPELGLLVSKFGLALITTIVGLAVRVSLVNFRVDVRQARDVVEEKLADSVRRFNRDVELACERLEILMTGTLGKIESTAQGMIDSSDDTAASLRETHDFHTEQLKEMYARVGVEWANSVTRLATAMEQQLAAAATQTLTKIDRIGKKIQDEVDSLSLDSAALAEYTSHLEQTVDSLTSLSESLGGINGQVATVARNFADLNRTISQSSSSFSEDVESSKENFLKLQQSLNVLLHAVASQSEQMAERVAQTSRDADRLLEALDESDTLAESDRPDRNQAE